MSDKIVYVLPKRGQMTLKQHIMLSMYASLGYKIQFLKSNDTCRGYKSNIVIDDYLDFDFYKHQGRKPTSFRWWVVHQYR